MRLTLRTLLCYLDDVLDPADAEDLGHKIQESPQAAKLAHHIRDVTRRLRLAAPRVDGKGLAVDANTVAEYLDNTLPTESYPDFEKVCLESDIHMAEVASCHQILTLVLGGPVEVDPLLRQRMYRIGHMSEQEREAEVSQRQVDAAAASVPAPKSTPALAEKYPLPQGPAADAKTVARSKPEVPDYMKAGRRSKFWPIAVALLLGFVLAAGALVAMGPLDEKHPLAKMFFTGTPVAQNSPPAPVTPTVTPPDLDLPEPKAPANGSATTASKPESPVVTPVDPAVPVTPAPPVELGQPQPVKPEPVVPAPPENKPAPSEVPAPAVTPPVEPKTAAPVNPPKGPQVALNNSPVKPPVEVKPAEVVQVARLASEDQVLARFLPEKQEWVRVAARASLMAGQQLVSPPTFRPQILLATSVQVTLDGGTLVTLESPAADGTPRVSVHSGRLLALTLGKAGTRVELALGQGPQARQGLLTFGDADSAAAVEVHRYRYPGTDPELAPSALVIQVFCTSGRVTWEQPGQVAQSVESGRVLNLVGDQPPSKLAANPLPDWIDGKNISDIDRRASRTLHAELSFDRPLGLALKEKAEDRRAEVKALAARSLGFFDQFDAAVAALADESQRSYWAAHTDMLFEALARDPQTAARVRVAFERVRLDAAKRLYRLLWSYSPEELAKGAASELVELLDDPALDVRVLAFENLRRITGTTLTYRPEAPRRSTTVLRWRERLKAGQIVYRTLPSPIAEVAAVAAKPAEEEKPAPEKPADDPSAPGKLTPEPAKELPK